MHILIAVFLACGLASAQTDPGTRPDASVPAINAGQLTIPAGTKVPVIGYRVTPPLESQYDTVNVVAIAHGKRKPGYWRKRLKK